MPSPTTVTHLVDEFPKAWSRGGRSVIPVHVVGRTHRFPIWIVVLWARIYDLKRLHQQPWGEAKHFVDQFETTARSGAAKEAVAEYRKLLDQLKWDAPMVGSGIEIPAVHVTPLLSTKWLSSDVVDLFLELLGHEATQGNTPNRVESLSTTTATQIHSLHHKHGTIGVPSGSRSKPHWLVTKAQKLRLQGAVLAGIIHVDGNYWVPFILGFSRTECFTGDSLRANKRHDIAEELIWFANLSSDEPHRFNHQHLSITKQYSHSCALWALDALRIHLNIQESLTDVSEFRLLRLKVFNQIGLRSMGLKRCEISIPDGALEREDIPLIADFEGTSVDGSDSTPSEIASSAAVDAEEQTNEGNTTRPSSPQTEEGEPQVLAQWDDEARKQHAQVCGLHLVEDIFPKCSREQRIALEKKRAEREQVR
jgi:hypothetical protein